jgi:hypothetical protein
VDFVDAGIFSFVVVVAAIFSYEILIHILYPKIDTKEIGFRISTLFMA